MREGGYDYIIIGAGAAGCVLANRLTADDRTTVLLIEAGGDDRVFGRGRPKWLNTLIHLPAGFSTTMHHPELTWGYRSEAEPAADGRIFDVTRGRVVGGCSSINGMLHVRGTRGDYDRWRDAGCSGWGWDDVLPYFRKSEQQLTGEDEWAGRDGPVRVSQAELFPVMHQLLDAAEAIGLPRAATFNDGTQFGGGPAQLSVYRGRRQSASVAYLASARRRRNLTLLTGAQVRRIRFENGRATGVEFVREHCSGTALARAEILLCAGAIGSPHLLNLSGIGDARRLRSLGIRPLVNRPEVGENLQDHYFTRIAWQLAPRVRSLNGQAHVPRLLLEPLRYLATRRGLLATAAAQVFLYAKSRPEEAEADLQFSVAPASVADMMPGVRRMRPDRAPGMTIGSCHLRPLSRGHVRIVSADPSCQPAIRFNYLSAAADQEAHIKGVRLARRLARQAALAPAIVREKSPGREVVSDEQILAYARARGGTVYHPVGTVRMGRDAASPLDPQLRVRGVEGLRVVDASIMPNLVSGNTHAPTVMIAERAASLILAQR
ncbi:GMC family oxidoreductase [Sphingomonas flavalba]|uniref:GMC family oxidoreductase n=1 Tax=Sphingomonas flavalba TaxID=2559804 RepID=UPI0039DF55F2